MFRRDQSLLTRLAIAGAAGFAVSRLPGHLRADPPAPTQPTLLQQISDETQKLYRQSRHSMVRVQLPTPQWLEQFNDRQQFLQKWGPLMDPDVRQKIMQQQERAISTLHQASTTNPSGNQAATTRPMSVEIHFADGPQPQPPLSLYAVGLLVDDQGHAAFPVYVDRRYVGNTDLPAVTGDGEATTAKFIGSDARTNLTVLQLARPTGTPVPLGHRRPDDGVLTLTIASDGGARLVVWNNQHPEPGLAVLPDGSVAGFGFDGHFLGASTAKPIVDQLIATGEVRRALLGVITQEVDRDDPIRREQAELGASPAIRIVGVQANSPAAIGGICKDDLILTIGDEAVGDPPTFAAVIATRRGDTVLHILRGGKVIERTVNLQAR